MFTIGVEVAGDKAGANALDLVRAGGPAADHRALLGLHSNHLHLGPGGGWMGLAVPPTQVLMNSRAVLCSGWC